MGCRMRRPLNGAVEWLRREIREDHAFAVTCLVRPFLGSDIDAIAERVARCEAELAILDELAAAQARARAQADDYDRWARGKRVPPKPVFKGPETKVIPGLERAVSLLASGYRHRPGCAEHWGQPAQGKIPPPKTS